MCSNCNDLSICSCSRRYIVLKIEMSVLRLESEYTVKHCLSPQEIPPDQFIFHRIVLLLSKYRYSIPSLGPEVVVKVVVLLMFPLL